MTHIEKIKNLIIEHNGIVTSAMLTKNNIPRLYLKKLTASFCVFAVEYMSVPMRGKTKCLYCKQNFQKEFFRTKRLCIYTA